MAVTRVFGRVDGTEVVLQYIDGERWTVPVPFDADGEYVVEIIAEDDAGNQSFVARMLYTVDACNICVHMLPLPEYIFERQASGFYVSRIYPVCQGVTA